MRLVKPARLREALLPEPPPTPPPELRCDNLLWIYSGDLFRGKRRDIYAQPDRTS